MTEHRVRLGVIGHGTVGAAFVRLVKQQSDTIAARSGVRLEVARVAVRNIDAHAGSIAAEVMTTDAEFVVNDPTVDLVVELMGGVDLPRKLILTALKNGKPVVTANKALLAQHGAELFAAADDAGIDLLFEAAVCGGIPLIRPLRESLRGEPIKRVLGIVNGTTNYILTKMSEEGQSYTDALAGAQALGYAEADPTADVEGLDAAAKVSIIASIAFGCNVVASDVYSEGISKISAADISIAKRLGYAVKLLAIAEYDKLNGEVSVRVHPAMVPMYHPLASVRDSFNAVVVDGEASGSLMFYGRGAGGDPTASSVLGDVIDASIDLNKGAHATLGGSSIQFYGGHATESPDPRPRPRHPRGFPRRPTRHHLGALARTRCRTQSARRLASDCFRARATFREVAPAGPEIPPEIRANRLSTESSRG